jgi:uncharacterized membrane protein YgdD (TMEM256/DUF423 family)
MNCGRTWIMLGAISACVAVVFGAFGAHGLEKPLEKIYGDEMKEIAGLEVPATYKYLRDFNTAARYQMYHALGLIALGIVASNPTTKSQRVAAWSFLIGTVLFSGSLYVLVLTGQRWLGAITPFGGLFLIAAWVAMAMGCRRHGDAAAEGVST